MSVSFVRPGPSHRGRTRSPGASRRLLAARSWRYGNTLPPTRGPAPVDQQLPGFEPAGTLVDDEPVAEHADHFLFDLPPARSAAVRGNKPAGPAVTVISNRRAADGPPDRGRRREPGAADGSAARALRGAARTLGGAPRPAPRAPRPWRGTPGTRAGLAARNRRLRPSGFRTAQSPSGAAPLSFVPAQGRRAGRPPAGHRVEGRRTPTRLQRRPRACC